MISSLQTKRVNRCRDKFIVPWQPGELRTKLWLKEAKKRGYNPDKCLNLLVSEYNNSRDKLKDNNKIVKETKLSACAYNNSTHQIPAPATCSDDWVCTWAAVKSSDKRFSWDYDHPQFMREAKKRRLSYGVKKYRFLVKVSMPRLLIGANISKLILFPTVITYQQ